MNPSLEKKTSLGETIEKNRGFQPRKFPNKSQSCSFSPVYEKHGHLIKNHGGTVEFN